MPVLDLAQHGFDIAFCRCSTLAAKKYLSPRAPRALFPLSVKRFGLGSIDPHPHRERTVWRGQPIGFLVLTGRLMLNVKRQTAVCIELELRQHR